MRTFNVTVKGVATQISCHSLHRPDSVTSRYRFLGFAGTVLYSFDKDEVAMCVEQHRIEVHAEPSPMSGRSCGISF